MLDEDLRTFATWALDMGWDDERVIALCEMFLAMRDAVKSQERDNDDVH